MLSQRLRQRKPTPVAMKDFRLVVQQVDGETRVYVCNVLDRFNAEHLKSGRIRLFDSSVDDRGPAVKFLNTYTNKDDVWFPETSGVYVLILSGHRPEELQRIQLGFGSASSPQSSKPAIAAALAEILDKWPQLKPFIRCEKRPCLFSADHPDAPGGSCIAIDIDSLPAPDKSRLTRIYS